MKRLRPQVLVLLLLLFVIGAAPRDGVRGGNAVEQIARAYVLDIIAWEAQQIAGHAPRLVAGLVPRQGDRDAEDREVVDYFLLTRDLRAANAQAQRLRDMGTPEEAQAAAAHADELEVRRAAAEPRVAELLTRHVSQELMAEGIELTIGPLRTPFPPVSFELTRPPSVLVVSPRSQIRLLSSIVLRPGLTATDIDRIEAALEARGYSVIVEPTGGFSTYPAMVPETAVMEFTLSSIVHEWLHAYFFLGPLGQNYAASGEMRTINETAADLAGNEVGARMAQRYRRLLPPDAVPPPPATGENSQHPPEPPPFDFTKEMRATRLHAEDLLRQGQVEEAERYMEERRLMFVRQGYLLRKLNQAYFAFHGSYADGPGSVSPIAGYLRQLRERAGSMAAFVRQMREVRTYADLLHLVGVQPGGSAGRESGG